MTTYFYEWLRNLACYMVLMTAVIQIVPNDSYKKYIRFFTGLILIVMLSEPLLRVVGMSGTFAELYDNAQYEQEKKKIEEKTEYLKERSLEEFFEKEDDMGNIIEDKTENDIENNDNDNEDKMGNKTENKDNDSEDIIEKDMENKTENVIEDSDSDNKEKMKEKMKDKIEDNIDVKVEVEEIQIEREKGGGGGKDWK